MEFRDCGARCGSATAPCRMLHTHTHTHTHTLTSCRRLPPTRRFSQKQHLRHHPILWVGRWLSGFLPQHPCRILRTHTHAHTQSRPCRSSRRCRRHVLGDVCVQREAVTLKCKLRRVIDWRDGDTCGFRRTGGTIWQVVCRNAQEAHPNRSLFSETTLEAPSRCLGEQVAELIPATAPV